MQGDHELASLSGVKKKDLFLTATRSANGKGDLVGTKEG